MKFPTFSLLFSWLDGPHSLPILHEIVWNLFIYREYFKILDTRGRFFKNNFVVSVVKYPPSLFLNWVIFSPPSETWNSLHFPDFFTHFPILPDFVSQFPTRVPPPPFNKHHVTTCNYQGSPPPPFVNHKIHYLFQTLFKIKIIFFRNNLIVTENFPDCPTW